MAFSWLAVAAVVAGVLFILLAFFFESLFLAAFGFVLIVMGIFVMIEEQDAQEASATEKKAMAVFKAQGFNIVELDAKEDTAVVRAGDCLITIRFQEPATLLLDGKNGTRYKFTPAMADAIADTCQP